MINIKPPAGRGINYGVAGQSLYGAWFFNELEGAIIDSHTKMVAPKPSGIIWSGTVTHPGLKFTAISDEMTLHSSNLAYGGLPINGVTILLGMEKTDATIRPSHPFRTDTGVVSRLQAHVPFSDGIVYFDVGGTTEGVSRLSVAGLTTSGQHVWCFTSGTRGMEIWQDGIKRASNTGNPSRSNDGTGFFMGNAGSTDFNITRFLVVFKSQLAPEMITRLSADPYQLLLPNPSRRLIYNPSSGTPITGLRPAMRVPNVLVF